MTGQSNLPPPPRLTERILSWSLPAGPRGRSILGDVREEFYERSRRVGVSRARRWFTRQAITLVVAYHAERLERRVGRLRDRLPRRATPSASAGARSMSMTLKPGDGMLMRLFQNLRYGWRGLRREPGFTAVVVVTLALGVGANATILSVLNTVLLRAMPYPEANRLVLLFETFGRDRSPVSASYLNFSDWRDQATTFDRMAAFNSGNSLTLTGVETPVRLAANFVSPAYFELIGARAEIGRLLTADDDDTPNGHPVVVLTYRLWQRQFGGDPNVVGRRVELGGTPYTVVGVTQAGLTDLFAGPAADTQIWVPLMMFPQVDRPDVFSQRRMRRFTVLGRLSDGATFAQAGAEMERVADRLATAFPDANDGAGAFLQPLRDALTTTVRGPIFALAAGALLVFLIASFNASSLFLVRSASRSHLAAIQLALGASTRNVAGRVMIEALLLALLGGTAGVLAATWAIPTLLALSPATLPGYATVRIDMVVLLAASLLTLAGGVGLGFGAALQATRGDDRGYIGSGSRSVSDRRQLRVRHALVVGEVAFALVLLVAAGLMLRSLNALRASEWGFRTDQLLTMQVDLPAARYDAQRLPVFTDALLERLNALPGVATADVWGPSPLGGAFWLRSTTVRGRVLETPDQAEFGRRHHVSPGALAHLGIEIVDGRDIMASDRNPGAPVVVISQALAQTLFPDGDAVGQFIRRFVAPGSPLDTIPWIQVVGVAADAKHSGRVTFPGAFSVDHDLYFSWYAQPERTLTLAVRTTDVPETSVAAVTNVIRELDDDLAVYGVQTMSDIQEAEEQNARFTALLMGIFGAMAVFLAALGLYGALAYSVTQRTREIGLRAALGATEGATVRMFVGEAMRLAALGVGLGLVAAFGVTRFVSSMLFGIQASDPLTFVGAPLLLLAISAVAASVPTRRAIKVDPALALRSE